jgi:hypothetical protein
VSQLREPCSVWATSAVSAVTLIGSMKKAQIAAELCSAHGPRPGLFHAQQVEEQEDRDQRRRDGGQQQGQRAPQLDQLDGKQGCEIGAWLGIGVAQGEAKE